MLHFAVCPAAQPTFLRSTYHISWNFSTKRPTACACFRLELLSPLPIYLHRPVSTDIILHCCLSSAWYNKFALYSTRKTILCGTLA
jgi:hypothetical protein